VIRSSRPVAVTGASRLPSSRRDRTGEKYSQVHGWDLAAAVQEPLRDDADVEQAAWEFSQTVRR